MRKRIIITSFALVGALGLAGCSSTADPSNTPAPSESAAGDAKITIVASTNVYADVAASIGGDHVDVLAVIESAALDPHSYEATPRDRLTVQKADLIVENGGGYDSYMTKLREGMSAPVITAFDELGEEAKGHVHSHGDEAEEHDHGAEDEHAEEDGHGHGHHHHHDHSINEHVWYDVEIMQHVAEHVKDELIKLDSDNSGDYQSAYEAFAADITKLRAEMEEVEKANGHVHVFSTEPISGYLLKDLDMHDIAPEGFASAVEEGNDVSPAVRLESRKLLESGEVKLVVSNVQTGGSETDEVEKIAEERKIPVVKLSELLPEGKSYVEWMRQNVQEIASALSSR